ncbi:ABC transporter permease [Ramlibacter rhizophilus]|uniref:ABC transporter permease n=2 Tax=Ramlibacter rhizophilus TaxID=1781167 RepID=A0A4Z0BLM7_9BURK|nr:ABC transporter permease [Ramlibacter rhizophilus]
MPLSAAPARTEASAAAPAANPPLKPRAARRRRHVPDWVWSVTSIAALLALWFGVTRSGLVKPGYLPAPETLWTTFLELLENGYQGQPLWAHIQSSLLRTLSGFAAGVLVGVPLGLFTGYNRLAGAVVSPIMAFIRPIPPIAFIPMAVLYFGLGELGKVVLIFFVSFNYVQTNAHAGAANFPIAYRRASESLGLTRWQTFVRIVLPGALPQIFTGLKVALALSWAVVVAAELVGAQSGLGFMISDAALLFRIPVVFIGIALIGAIGLALNLTLNAIEARVVHWKGR